MPFGIVTGFTEVEHITPHNLKSLNAAVAGSGNYVLKIGKQLQASMQTANKLRVLDGYGMMGGAQWGMEPGEYVDLTIDNGTQGMNRVDLVVARYARTGAKNIESVTLRVIKGTPSSGTPSVPAFVTGDILAGAATAEMPLYKVQLSGLTVAAPVEMFEVLTPAKDAWDSLSHDTGWVNMYVSGTLSIVARRVGNMVTVIGESWGDVVIPKEWYDITTVSEQFRPSRMIYAAGTSIGGDIPLNIRVKTTGVLGMISKATPTDYWTFSMSYPIG